MKIRKKTMLQERIVRLRGLGNRLGHKKIERLRQSGVSTLLGIKHCKFGSATTGGSAHTSAKQVLMGAGYCNLYPSYVDILRKFKNGREIRENEKIRLNQLANMLEQVGIVRMVPYGNKTRILIIDHKRYDETIEKKRIIWK